MIFGDKLRAHSAERKLTLTVEEREAVENDLMMAADKGKDIKAYVVSESTYERASAYDKWSKANNINFEYFDADDGFWFRFSW